MDQNGKTLGKWSPNWEGLFKSSKYFRTMSEVEELGLDNIILRINGNYLKKYKPVLQEIKIS